MLSCQSKLSVMAAEALGPFSFPRWFHLFTKVTIKSKIISLPPEFMAWLCADGIMMPMECEETESLSGDDDWSDEDEDEAHEGSEDDGGNEGKERHKSRSYG